MKQFLAIIIPMALLGACETLPAGPAMPAPAPIADASSVGAEAAQSTESAQLDAGETEAKETAASGITQKQTYVRYQTSPLVSSLVSESVMNDDVALMGLLSGARAYCGLDWQPGFVTFINLANNQKLNLGTVADDHGYYLGAAKRALEEAEYECTEQDYIELRAIDPY
jgi:hypothetical protein